MNFLVPAVMKVIKIDCHAGLINLPILFLFGKFSEETIDFTLFKCGCCGLIAIQIAPFDPVQEKGDLFAWYNPFLGQIFFETIHWQTSMIGFVPS
jgi:hypothetical protein